DDAAADELVGDFRPGGAGSPGQRHPHRGLALCRRGAGGDRAGRAGAGQPRPRRLGRGGAVAARRLRPLRRGGRLRPRLRDRPHLDRERVGARDPVRPTARRDPRREGDPVTRDPWHLLEEASLVLAVHAHPDDESLSTGALLASLATAGTRVALVTATRGEEGAIVAGAIDPADRRALEEGRTREIGAAVAALGIAARHMLGSPPALADGAEPREYRDSGMQWVREGLAGPAETAGPTSFTHRPRGEAVDDLVALIETLRPDVVIGYDDAGSYGHPDHVHAHHEIGRAHV